MAIYFLEKSILTTCLVSEILKNKERQKHLLSAILDIPKKYMKSQAGKFILSAKQLANKLNVKIRVVLHVYTCVNCEVFKKTCKWNLTN